MGAFEILDNISGYHEYDISDAQKLRFVSDSLCRMTGYSKNELTDSEYGYTVSSVHNGSCNKFPNMAVLPATLP